MGTMDGSATLLVQTSPSFIMFHPVSTFNSLCDIMFFASEKDLLVGTPSGVAFRLAVTLAFAASARSDPAGSPKALPRR